MTCNVNPSVRVDKFTIILHAYIGATLSAFFIKKFHSFLKAISLLITGNTVLVKLFLQLLQLQTMFHYKCSDCNFY